MARSANDPDCVRSVSVLLARRKSRRALLWSAENSSALLSSAAAKLTRRGGREKTTHVFGFASAGFKWIVRTARESPFRIP